MYGTARLKARAILELLGRPEPGRPRLERACKWLHPRQPVIPQGFPQFTFAGGVHGTHGQT